MVNKKMLIIKLSILLLTILLIRSWLYRSPQIITPSSNNVIVSPSFGKVEKIIKNNDKVSIQIKLDLLDPHHQYFPISGLLTHQQYIKGTFTPIISKYFEKSDNNERMITIVNDFKITQIAGIVFKRIVANNKIGDDVNKGDKLGMIKMGSRVDVEFPIKYFNNQINEGDYLKGGESIIGYFV